MESVLVVLHEMWGALTVSVFNVDVDLTSAGGVVSVGVSVLLQMWVAGPSRVDVTTMLMEALEVYWSVFDIHQS